jgi:hypothetical protein
MRRKLTTLKAKGGHTQNGAPRAAIDDATYREHWNFVNNVGLIERWDPRYSGWSNASRPKDYAISIRPVSPVIPSPPAPPPII